MNIFSSSLGKLKRERLVDNYLYNNLKYDKYVWLSAVETYL